MKKYLPHSNIFVLSNLITSNLYSRGSTGGGQLLGLALLVLFVSLGMFFISLRNLRFNRFIRNIPTSKLGSLAVGLAEVNGKVVRSDELLRSPIHNVECVFYETFVEVKKIKLRNNTIKTVWKKIYKKAEYVHPFSISDESGTVNVDLEGAQVEFETDHDTEGHKMGENEDLDNFCKKNNIKMKGWFFRKKLRYNETYIEPDDELYILGKAEIRSENGNDTLTILASCVLGISLDPA